MQCQQGEVALYGCMYHDVGNAPGATKPRAMTHPVRNIRQQGVLASWSVWAQAKGYEEGALQWGKQQRPQELPLNEPCRLFIVMYLT